MRVLHGRGVFWTLCVLLLTGTATAQTYPTTNSPNGYGYGFAAPTARQASHQDSTPPQTLQPVYAGPMGYYGPQEQAPVQAPVQAPMPAYDPYQSAMNDNWDACEPGCAPPRWFGSAGAVFLSRSDRNFPLSCECTEKTLMYNDAGMPTTVGPSLTLGRYLGCNGCFGVEFVYWGLYPSTQTESLYATAASGPLSSTIDWSGMGYTAAVDPPLATVFDNAAQFRVQREFSVNNFEFNFLTFSSSFGNGCGSQCGSGACNTCGPNLRYSFLAGLRFLNFNESMLFSADRDDTVWGNSADELHYFSEVQNRMAGFQVGGRTDYFFLPCLSAFATAKGGVYGNDMSMHQSIYNQIGFAHVTNPVSSNLGRPYDIYGSKTGVSFLTEFSVGANWKITNCWSAYAGYQVIAATGVAEVNDQIPTQFYQLQENSQIKSDGVLILHGAFAGLSYNF